MNKQIAAAFSVAVGILLSVPLSARATVYHVATDGVDSADGLTTSTPLATLEAALAKSADGDRILVGAGTYVIPAGREKTVPWITIDKGVVLEGSGGPEATILDGGGSTVLRAVKIDHPAAVFSGFTIRRVRSSIPSFGDCGPLQIADGVVTNCIIRDNKGYYCDAVGMDGGLLVDSIVRDNYSNDSLSKGGGIYLRSGAPRVVRCEIAGNRGKLGAGIYISEKCTEALVSHCHIHHNTNDYTGRGEGGAVQLLAGVVENCVLSGNLGTRGAGAFVDGGTLRGCLVEGNHDVGQTGGGGVYLKRGTVENCTIVKNTSDRTAQGLYQAGGALSNSIVLRNGTSAELRDPDNYIHGGGTATALCAYPVAEGTGNWAKEPLFLDFHGGDYRLSPASPCRDAGGNADWMASAKDIAGGPRVVDGTVDLGAYEMTAAGALGFCCDIEAEALEGGTPFNVSFRAKVFNPPGGPLTCRWDLGDGTTGEGETVSTTYGAVGRYTVSLTVTAGDDEVARRAETLVTVRPGHLFVSPEGGHEWPYDTWAKASTNLQVAIDAASGEDGSTRGVVEVAPGRYPWDGKAPMAVLGKNVLVTSSDGPETTILDGKMSPSSVSCVLVTGPQAVFSGFTIAKVNSSIPMMGRCGPLMISAGVVTNCVIRENLGTWSGAIGMTGGLLVDSLVEDNRSSDSLSQSGGIHLSSGDPEVLRCELTGNKAKLGPALYMAASGGVVRRCRIHHNTSEKTSRGAGGAVELLRGLVENCEIVDNLGTKGAGVTLSGGTVRGSLIAGNRDIGSSGGGGVYQKNGLVESCTIVANASASTGQGLFQAGGRLLNSIVIRNGAGGNVQDAGNHHHGGGEVAYTCTYPPVEGEGNRSEDPNFIDYAAADYRLSPVSPCRDKGLAVDWMGQAKDLDGNDRVIDGLVDLGAYEVPETASLPFSCDIEITAAEGVAPLEVLFKARAFNPPAEVTGYSWNFGDGTTGEGERITKTYDVPGAYTVSLTVVTPAGQAARSIRDAVRVCSDHVFVAPDGAHLWPYDTWAKAATNIQEAIDTVYVSGSGAPGVVEVAPGTYRHGGKETSVVTLGKGVRVMSIGGPYETVLDGEGVRGGLWLNHDLAVFSGFSVTNCRLVEVGGLELFAGTATNCIFSGNGNSYFPGGRMHGGLLIDSSVTRSVTKDYGGGGGGHTFLLKGGEVVRCHFTNNTDVTTVGGVEIVKGTIRESVIANNVQWLDLSNWGGGLFLNGDDALVDRCVVTNNLSKARTARGGGGVYLKKGTLRNSLVAWNRSGNQGGGIYLAGGVAENLTVTGNESGGDPQHSAGVYLAGGVLRNSIVHGNGGTEVQVVGGVVEHTCSSPLLAGTGNLAAEPRFRAPAKGDFSLRPSSPCLDAGRNLPWMEGAVDLAGADRIYPGVRRTVDLGAFEGEPPTGVILMIR